MQKFDRKILTENRLLVMINRELIRQKVVQLVYSHYKNPDKSIEDSVEELFFSLDKAYDLYLYLLRIIPEITDYARERYEITKERLQVIGSQELPNPKFVNNRFAAQLDSNTALNDFYDSAKAFRWTNAFEEIQVLYKAITESEIYLEYMANQVDTYEQDRLFWRKIYKKFVCNNESLENALEEYSIYWNDDKHIVDTFVLKTINRFVEENGAAQPLLEDYASPEDKEFAKVLFSSAIANFDDYQTLIAKNTHKWDINRLPILDVVIMVTALAEVQFCPEISLDVTFNEYIEIAKVYSTPKNAKYINGILDSVVRKLQSQNLINK